MMNQLFRKKPFAFGLAMLVAFAMLGSAFAPSGQASAAPSEAAAGSQISVTDAVYSAAEYVLAGGVNSDWQAIGLVKAGYKVEDNYLQTLEVKVKEAKGDFSRATDTARITLAVKALGGDPENVGGYNLIEKLYTHDKIAGQTLNNAVYALLALDSGSYSIPQDALWTKAKLLEEIIAKQNADGGFTLTTGASDPDMTAMALTVLAGHKDAPEAVAAGERAVKWLSGALDANGGYGDSSESTAQAIIALSSFGIDPAGADFAKAGTDLVDKLFSYRTANGGFAHNTGGSANSLSTEQALLALAAYRDFGQNSGKLYDFSGVATVNPLVQVSVAIEGPDATLAQADVYADNALEALEKAAEQQNVALVNESGNYVTGIGGIDAGKFGGYDGWMYIVSRGGEWVYPSVGMNDFALQENDRVVVYYGGDQTQFVDNVTLSPQKPQPGESFTLTVTRKQWVWNAETFTSDPVSSPAAGVQVVIGGKTLVTDAAGQAAVEGGLAAGRYTLTASGYSPGNAPELVRYTETLAVGSAEAFADENDISPWALEAVRAAHEQGLMQGVSTGGAVFAPKQYITRAEFAALLLRLTGNEPSSAAASGFSDVQADAWYYGAVNTAKALGYIGGSGSSFNPDGVITRQDMAVMITRAYDLDERAGGSVYLSDENEIGAYALDAVRTVTGLGLMSLSDWAFDPSAKVTREMAAVVAIRLP